MLHLDLDHQSDCLFSQILLYSAIRSYGGHAQCPEYCLTQSLLGTIIFLHFNSYLCKGKEETHATGHALYWKKM